MYVMLKKTNVIQPCKLKVPEPGPPNSKRAQGSYKNEENIDEYIQTLNIISKLQKKPHFGKSIILHC